MIESGNTLSKKMRDIVVITCYRRKIEVAGENVVNVIM